MFSRTPPTRMATTDTELTKHMLLYTIESS
jgi:hypothetical protein